MTLYNQGIKFNQGGPPKKSYIKMFLGHNTFHMYNHIFTLFPLSPEIVEDHREAQEQQDQD